LWRSKFRNYTTSLQNYAAAGGIHMKMLMFATLAKAKLNTESIKGPNLVTVRHMTVQTSKLFHT
jgi:hypothetical protein